jgi:hypothetical protein
MKSHKLPPTFYKRILEFTRLKRHEKDLFEGSDDVSVIQRISGTDHSIKYLKKCTDRENQDLLEELKVQVGPFYNPLGATNG